MPSDTIKSLLRELYLTSGDYGGVEPELNDIMNYYGEEDPDFIGSLRQEGTDLMRRKRNPNRALTSPASSDVLGSTEPFGFDEAMDEFQSNPRGVMDNYAAVNLAPDGKGGGLANLPLEKGSFSSQLANVAEALPVVGPMFDPMFRTENESRALEDRNQVLDFTKTASEAFPIAAGAAAAGGAVGLGVVGSAALGGGVADVMLGGAPFVDGMTPEQNKQRLLSIGISTATGGIGGKASQYINKWAGNRALEAFKKLAIPGKATDDLIESASKKTLDPMALASALTGGRVEGIAPHIQAAAKIAGQKSLTNASKSVLGNEIKEIATSALRKDFAIDLALGAGQAEVTAQATEGRHATGMELGMGLAVSGAVHGARGAGESSAMKKVQSQILGGMKETAPVKAAPKPVDPATQTQAEADAQAAFKTTTEVKPTAKAPTVDYSKFPSAGEAARAAHHEVMKAGGSEADAEKARKRAAARYKAWENTLPEAEKAARVKARDDAKKAPKPKTDRAVEEAGKQALIDEVNAMNKGKAPVVDSLPMEAPPSVKKAAAASAKKTVDESTTIPPEIKEELKVAIDKAAAEPANLAEPLKGAKPRYSYGNRQFDVEFDNDVDKAAYIVAQSKKSKKNDEYLKFVMDSLGMTDQEAISYGIDVKSRIKKAAEEAITSLSKDTVLRVGKVAASMPKAEAPVNFDDPPFEKFNDEPSPQGETNEYRNPDGSFKFPVPDFLKTETAPQGETNEYRNPDGSFKFPVPDFLKTETAPKAEELTLDRINERAFDEQYDEKGVLEQQPDIRKGLPTSEDLSLKHLERMMVDSEYAYDPSEFEIPDLKKNLIDEYVAEAEDDLIFSDTIDEWKAQIAKRAELRKFSKDPEGDYKADSDMFTRLAGLIGQERAAATNDVMRSEVQEKIDFLMKEAQKSRDDFLLKQEKLRPSSARETVKEVEQPKLSEEQSAANVAHGLRLMFEKYKRPELESLADEYLELAGGTSKTVNDADAIEAANKFLSNYRKSKVSERIASGNKEESRTVRAKDDEEAKERRRLLMDDVEKAEGKRREKPLTAPSEKEEYRKMAEAEGRLQPKKAKTGLSKKQLKAEADKLLAEAENPGEVKLEAEAPKRDRIAEMKAAQERLKAGVKDEPPVPEEVKSVEGVDVVKQMEDLQDRIDNLDEAEFGDEWKDNRRREIEELLRRGKSKKKDIQESITDEEREFLDSYHEAEGEFKDELKAENKERDSGDKMDKEERAELLAEKLDEWLDEHIDNEAGERSSEAAETLQAEMDRLQQIRDNPKRPPTDTQFRLSEEFEADKTYDEAKAAVEKAETDAVFSAKGEKAMADHIDQAVKSGKVSKDIGDGLTQVIKKYGKNLKHVSLAFSDDLPAGVKGAFKPAKDTIMLSAERMTHEGIAAGLEELFHGMEKVVSPEARIEIKKAYEKEMAQEIKGLQEALAWARKNNRTDMASDIQGTLTWLAKAAKGQAEGLPPIRDYYKFSDASEYFADRMMNYEWDRLSGFTHPDDSSLVGRASKWFRGLANEITDTFEAKWGEDRLKREWLKLGRMEQRVQGDNKSLAQAVWFDDQSQTRKWADDFLLRPGDGLFSVKQQSLAPDVEAAMLRTTPSSVKPKSLTTRLSETHGFDPSNQARFMTRLVTKLFDEFHWLKKWEDTASTWFSAEGGVQRGLDPADSGLARMRTAAQSNALVEHTLTDGQLRFDPEDGTFHPKEGRALKQIWGDAYKAGVEPQFKAFLYASRVEETSSKKGVSSGWKQEEIDAAKAYGKTEVAPGKTIESLANEVHDWMRSFLDIAEAAGIIDPSARAGWEEANYIPFLLEKSLARPFEQSGGYGAFAENSKAVSFDNQNFFDQAGGMANLNAALTKADPDIYQRKDFKEGMYHQDVMEGLVRMSKHLLQMSVKNSAARKTLENFTNPDYGDISTKRYSAEEYEKLKNKGGKKFLTALEGGKTVYFEVVDPELYNMMTNFGADKYKRFSQHPVIKALFVTPSRLFSSFITRAPEFLGVNPLRDSMALWATGTAGDATSSRDAFVDAVANIGKNYRDMGRTFYDFFGNEVTKLTRDPELMAMSAAGLAGAGYYGTEAGDIARNIGGEIRSESSKFRTINPVEWYRWMGKVAAVGELRTRRTKYDQVMKAGGTHAEAVQRSLDLINYSNRGSSELLGFFLDTVPFLKARMSGLYKLGRTLSTLPHADKSKRQRILAASVFHRTAIMAIASSLMYMYNMTENKDRYESLDENQRDAYWHMWLGDYHVQIPKPFEIGALAGALPERAADLLTGKGTMGDFGDFMMRTLINNFQLAQLPHTLVPIKEQLENKVGYTQRPIVSAAQEEVEPEAQYTASTSETAKQLADLAPDNAPDWMRSPSRIQHLLDSYFATMGEYAVFATDSMLRAAGKTSNPPAEHTDRLPGLNAVGRLVRKEPADRPRSTKYVASYYDFQRKLDRMNNTIMNYRKLGKYKKADDLQKKFQEDAATYYKGRGLSQYLSAISQQQRRVFESDTMTPDQKRKEIDRLRIQSNKAIETFEKERRKNK